jgi:hypothetical protein
MGLEALCIELDVEHKKLTETVKHEDITLENYHESRPTLDLYLSHDVRGLLEVMLKFNRSVHDDLGIDTTQCFTGASLSDLSRPFLGIIIIDLNTPSTHYQTPTTILYAVATLGVVSRHSI